MDDSRPQPAADAKNERGGRAKSELSDSALLAAVAAGQMEAFWILWSRYQSAVRQVCMRNMGGNLAEADDALSQVMLKAQSRLPSSAGKIIQVEAWLRQLARNLCMDLHREGRRRSEIGETWKDEVLVAPAQDESSTQLGMASEIQMGIAALPPPLRESFTLHIVQGIPANDVAARLKLSSANVRKRVQLARARLRRDLRGHRPGDGEGQALPAPVAPAAPAAARPSAIGSGELFPCVTHLRTVRVKLFCDVEQLFHIFPAKAPFALDRKLKTVQRQVQAQPDNWKLRLELADLLYQVGAWQKAINEWRQIAASPASLPAALKLGDALLKLGGIESATGIFDNLRRQEIKSPATGRHLSGWLAFCQQDAARAVVEFQAALDLEPGNPAHWHCLALARRRSDDLPAALAAIQGALTINADDWGALSLGHEMLMAAGEPEEAFRRASHLSQLAPQDLLTLLRLVECRCQLQLVRGAAGRETIRLLRRAQRLAPNTFLFHESLTSFFLAQGNTPKALAFCREFAERHPQCLRNRQWYSHLRGLTGASGRTPAAPAVRKLPATDGGHGGCWGLKPLPCASANHVVQSSRLSPQ